VSGASSTIATSVTVAVPARLHLGFLDLNGELGRLFGSIGLAISGLGTTLTIRRASKMQIVGPERERIRHHIDTMEHILGVDAACEVTIDEAVPAHVGLGSGTQIALAIAAGMRRLHGRSLDVRGDAIRLERGARSGLGVGVFEHGGLLVDGGRGSENRAAPIVSRMAFPERWRVLVLLDPKRRGLHGSDERAAFASLPPFPGDDAAHFCRLVLMKALPAVAEDDLASFGAAIAELQARLGDYYAPVQGGHRFASPDVAAALEMLTQEGAAGAGQSSWGPTGYAFVPSVDEAMRLLKIARRHPDCRDLDIRVCAALNRGAEIRAVAHASELQQR
jgi:beta-RFAP synthase